MGYSMIIVCFLCGNRNQHSYVIAGMLLITNVNPVFASNLKQEEIIQELGQSIEDNPH